MMTDAGMVEYFAQVKDLLNFDLPVNLDLDPLRKCYLAGFHVMEAADYMIDGTYPDRFINVLEV